MMFASRAEAGKLLAEKLRRLPLTIDTVLGIPRGGVLVATAIARELAVTCAPIVTKKLSAPKNKELAIGAVSSNSQLFDEVLIAKLGVGHDYLQKEIEVKQVACRKREWILAPYRLVIKGKTVVLTDDGVATGWTLQVAIEEVKRGQPATIIIALPVAPADIADSIRRLVSPCIILAEPVGFEAVGQYYRDFHEVSDQETRQALQSIRKRRF